MDLSHIPLVDQHAHNVLRPESAARLPFAAAFTECSDVQYVELHAQQTLAYCRSIRDIAELLECDPSEDAILAHRASLGMEALTARCFRRANLQGVLIDDGFLPDDILPLEWHNRFVPAHRLLRIELLAEQLLREEDRFEVFLDRFRGALDPPPANVVGFKSIVAYRSGLAIGTVSRKEAEASFAQWKSAGTVARLRDKMLLDFLFSQALEIAARRGLPMQLHTGFGDTDLDLRLGNPLHLRCVLENSQYQNAKLILLHASYPFMREAGYLASVYRQVYLDLGLAIPLLSIAGMREAVRQLLELAPFTKLMYSSDARLIPEMYYLAAKWGRSAIATVLEGAVADGDLSAMQAEQASSCILAENARQLYRLDPPAE